MSIPFEPQTFQSTNGNWYWYEPNRRHTRQRASGGNRFIVCYVYGPFKIEALADKDSILFFYTRTSSASNRWDMTTEEVVAMQMP